MTDFLSASNVMSPLIRPNFLKSTSVKYLFQILKWKLKKVNYTIPWKKGNFALRSNKCVCVFFLIFFILMSSLIHQGPTWKIPMTISWSLNICITPQSLHHGRHVFAMALALGWWPCPPRVYQIDKNKYVSTGLKMYAIKQGIYTVVAIVNQGPKACIYYVFLFWKSVYDFETFS